MTTLLHSSTTQNLWLPQANAHPVTPPVRWRAQTVCLRLLPSWTSKPTVAWTQTHTLSNATSRLIGWWLDMYTLYKTLLYNHVNNWISHSGLEKNKWQYLRRLHTALTTEDIWSHENQLWFDLPRRQKIKQLFRLMLSCSMYSLAGLLPYMSNSL